VTARPVLAAVPLDPRCPLRGVSARLQADERGLVDQAFTTALLLPLIMCVAETRNER
jgi:hypothetical protein